MRNVLFFMMVTVDGYVEGPGRDITWHNADEEFGDFAADQLRSIDTLLLGRITYELFAGYWPTPEAVESDPVIAEAMNSIPKVVFSRTMREAAWNNTAVVGDDAAETVAVMREQPGGEMAIFGSGHLATSLAERGQIDEFRLMVNPIALGAGTPLFAGMSGRLDLTLVEARPFTSGNTLLIYHPRGR